MRMIFDHVALCSNRRELEVINREEVTLAILNREVNRDLRKGLKSLKRRLKSVHKGLADSRCIKTPVLKSAVYEFLTESCFTNYLTGEIASVLAQDITGLINIFVSISGKDNIAVNLDYETKNELGYFHVDGLSLRLIATYFGPGTEWLPNQEVDICALRKGEVRYSLSGFGQMIQRMRNDQIAILKGRNTVCTDKLGLVHRKPIFSEEPRLRLIID